MIIHEADILLFTTGQQFDLSTFSGVNEHSWNHHDGLTRHVGSEQVNNSHVITHKRVRLGFFFQYVVGKLWKLSPR